MNAWRCTLHHLNTTTDCPKCDAEQIADLEAYAKLPACQVCTRSLREGEEAWASDWTVVDEKGTRREIRYMCDDCSGGAA